MAISTTAFGVYFYLISKMHSTTSLSLLMLDVQSKASEEPHTDLAWLALASMAVFITGEILAHILLSLLLKSAYLYVGQHENVSI